MKLSDKVMHQINEMSRGVVVVDEDIEGISNNLASKNIRVINVKKGTKDKFIKEIIIPKRIFITNNSKDFISGIHEYEYTVIATDKLSNKDPEILADLISAAITKFSLWSKSQGYLLQLSDDGKHKLTHHSG